MNDNEESPAMTPPDGLPVIFTPENIPLHPDFGDPSQLLNMRYWLQAAIEAKGGRQTGAGFGMGSADIDFILEGHGYNVVIKPIIKG